MKHDLIQLESAINYIADLANGRNPLNHEAVENEVLDDPKVIRCFNFISEVLKDVRSCSGIIENQNPENREGIAGERNPENLDSIFEKRKTKKKAERKDFPFEVLSQFKYKQDRSVTYVLKQFAEPLGDENVRIPNPVAVNKWLAKNGYIEKKCVEGSPKESWFPTEKGEEIGMYVNVHGSIGKKYVTVMYSRDAQQFLADNLEQILKGTE